VELRRGEVIEGKTLLSLSKVVDYLEQLKGWLEAIPQMSLGERIRLVVPA
jgi:FKBP-type peptidyl-prolyl cis-trans isomerase